MGCTITGIVGFATYLSVFAIRLPWLSRNVMIEPEPLNKISLTSKILLRMTES